MYEEQSEWLLQAAKLLWPAMQAAGLQVPNRMVGIGCDTPRTKHVSYQGRDLDCVGETRIPPDPNSMIGVYVSPSCFNSQYLERICLPLGSVYCPRYPEVMVLSVLAHEMCHAVLWAISTSHDEVFAAAAECIGLLPPWTATIPGPRFMEICEQQVLPHLAKMPLLQP